MNRTFLVSRLLLTLLVFSTAASIGCSDECPTECQNRPPAIPSLIMPQHQAVNISVIPLLHWTCSDPDGDPLTFDVYLDTTDTPKIRSSRQSSVVYSPDSLSSSQRYYWKIVAHDSRGDSTVSPLWEFVTRAVQHWSTLGSGLNGNVYSLTSYNGMLIAGGDFTMAGGTDAQHIAAWNGSTWSPLGEGTAYAFPDVYDPGVRALTVYHGQLVAAGGFGLAGGKPIKRLAMWDGSEWSAVGTAEFSGGIKAVAVFEDRLIVGNYYYSSGTLSSSIISAWDGLTWSSVGSGIDGMKEVLCMYANDYMLVVGGVPANSHSGYAVAVWDGTSWSNLGSPGGYAVEDVLTIDQTIIITGECQVSRWDGTQWQLLAPL